MATLHITVANQPGLSGDCTAPFDNGASYACLLGTFPITPAGRRGLHITGNGSTLSESGKFQISGVGDGYETVTFDGNFIVKGGKGAGTVHWSGPHPIGDKGGPDTWTSDTTTPKPHPRHAKAKGQGK
jgi:hypothetical protein